ncbi:MAG: hypothetical protein ACRC3Z_00720 [Phocaeicola sp.]
MTTNNEKQAIKSTDTIQGKCPSCGGILVYSPEHLKLACEYCAAQVELNLTPAEVKENSYDDYENNPELHKQSEIVVSEVACGQCGAHTTFPENTTAFSCAFCGTPIVLKNAEHNRIWKPEYILPFKQGKKKANDSFKAWINSLWFAPSKLSAQLEHTENMKGVYLPYWTYDANTTTFYRGERGTHRQESIRVNGKIETRTVTDWRSVSGTVGVEFDDVLVPASKSLPPTIAQVLTNWDKQNYVAYDEVYLKGFLSELYQSNFKECLPEAKREMERLIRSEIQNEIGGHEQRINQCDINYADIKFKHVLLPVWLSAYRYQGKSYIFAVNGRTGQVVGERPWSTAKIAALCLVIATILGFLFYYA